METNLSEGSVLKRLIIFALPFLASNVVQSLYNVADMLIVGQFSTTAEMSGVQIGGQITFVLTNTIAGLCVGATVLIGQYVGRGDKERLKKVISTTITLLLVISVVVTIVCLIFKEGILGLMKTPAESFAASDSYLAVTVSGLIFIFCYNAFAGILRGMGDSRRPFYFVTVACVTNIGLDLLFVAVFGWGAFGAAFATVISQALSVVLCVIYMVRSDFPFDFKPSSYRMDKEHLGKVFKIGLPSAVQNSVVGISFIFITAVVNIIADGSAAQSAAVGAVGKFNTFAFMPLTAISMSIASIAAHNIGAGRMDRAIKTTKIGLLFCVVLMYSFCAIIQIFPEPIVRIFTRDPDVIAAGVLYIRGIAWDFLLIPIIFCVNGFLIGGGHTLVSLIFAIVSSIALRVPASYILGALVFHNLTGVGLGAPIASCGTALALVCYMISGRWKQNAVRHNEPTLEIMENEY